MSSHLSHMRGVERGCVLSIREEACTSFDAICRRMRLFRDFGEIVLGQK